MRDKAPHRKDFATRSVPARERLAKLIRQARAGEDITQAALAVKAGVGPNRIYEIESGSADPKLSTLEKVAGALGLELTLRDAA